MFAEIPLTALPIGAMLASPLHDQGQTKLLAAGIEITEQLLVTLRRRNVNSVFISKEDLARINAFCPQGVARTTLPGRPNVRTPFINDVSRDLDRQVLATLNGPLVSSADPFARRLARHGATPYDRDYLQFLAEQHERCIRHLNGLTSAVTHGESGDVRLVGGIVGNTLDQAAEDLDAFVCLGANPFGLPYPGRHSTHVAMLAMAIGASMGLDEQLLVELGTGCWIHDIGMAVVDPRVLEANRVLNPGEFGEITKHPIKTFELIEANIDCVPAASRMVAYQMHERCDGSGYPRGRTLAQTHPLARIAAVADAFAALVAPRPHREGMQPYYAMEKMLKDTKQGLFDPKATRGLLETVSLFPIGSFVAMNKSDYVGRIIRSNGPNFNQPVVEVWRSSNLGAQPAIVDLRQEDQLQIARPLAALQ